MRTRYSDAQSKDRSKLGINRLLNNGAYLSAFPLHDGGYKEDPSSGPPNDRRVGAADDWTGLYAVRDTIFIRDVNIT